MAGAAASPSANPNATKTVLVTGANSGLGLATALEVARRGFHTVGTVRTEAKADVVREAAARAGTTVHTTLLDVTDAPGCAAVVDGLDHLYGLVNNAGYSITGAVEEVDDDEARAVLETMVIAPMRLARLAVPAMRANDDGCIVNVSSIYGRTTTPFTGWYQGAKHALEAVTDALRVEVARDGIRVALVEPGGFRTAIFDEVERDVARRGDTRYAEGYGRLVQAMRAAGPLLGDPRGVARLIGHILESRAVKARYLVGPDAQAAALSARLTPTLVRDLVARRVLGL